MTVTRTELVGFVTTSARVTEVVPGGPHEHLPVLDGPLLLRVSAQVLLPVWLDPRLVGCAVGEASPHVGKRVAKAGIQGAPGEDTIGHVEGEALHEIRRKFVD